MSDEPKSTPSRRLYWHCFYDDCQANFVTTTRKGLRVTCPKCHRVQDGPTAIKARLKELESHRARTRGKPKVDPESDEPDDVEAESTAHPARVDAGSTSSGILRKLATGDWNR